jgi:hypothetical protein
VQRHRRDDPRRGPGLPIGRSTSEAIDHDPFAGAATVRSGRRRPDFVSVNLAELGLARIVRAALHAGIDVEAGPATPADAEELARSPSAYQIVRALVEVDGGVEEARAIARLIPDGVPQLWHGYGPQTWGGGVGGRRLRTRCARRLGRRARLGGRSRCR